MKSLKRKSCVPFILIGTILACFAYAIPAKAQLTIHVRINDLPPIINPSDTVVIAATLFNDSDSTENLGVIGGNIPVPPEFDFRVGAFASLPNGYSCQWGSDGSLQDQFIGVDLAPGETFDFIFHTCTPDGGSASLGTYVYTGQLQVYRRTDSDWTPVSFKSDSIIWNIVNDPKPDVSGCINYDGSSLVGAEVTFKEQSEKKQIVQTDENGCFAIETIESGEKGKLTIEGFSSE